MSFEIKLVHLRSFKVITELYHTQTSRFIVAENVLVELDSKLSNVTKTDQILSDDIKDLQEHTEQSLAVINSDAIKTINSNMRIRLNQKYENLYLNMGSLFAGLEGIV